jgi:hypothetical protein
MMIRKDHFLGLVLVWCAGIAMLLSGCSHESDDIPTARTTSEILMAKGWNDFLGGDYSSAITSFRQILNRDATITEAYVGLGWSYTYAGTFDKGLSNFIFAQARPDFKAVPPDHDGYEAEVYAGMASNYAATNEDSLAIFYAQKSLAVDPAWVFRMDDALTNHDLKVLIAQSYFNDRKYYDAKEQVDDMAPGWSSEFETETVTDMIIPLEWSVSNDSTRVSFQVPEPGISSFAEGGETTVAVGSVPAPGINACNCRLEVEAVTDLAKTEYWVLTCIEEEKRGGVFEVIGSVSGPLEPFDIFGIASPGSTLYVSDYFTLNMHFKDIEKTRDRDYPEIGDTYTFATAEGGIPFTVNQVKDGNRIFISLDPAATDAKFFRDVEYTIFLEYSYFNDFGNFLVRLMEKINSLFL